MSGHVRQLHRPLQSVEVVTVKLALFQRFSPLLYVGVVIVGFSEIQVILAVIGVYRYELAADRAVYLTQHRLDQREQILGRLTPQFLNTRLPQTQPVP